MREKSLVGFAPLALGFVRAARTATIVWEQTPPAAAAGLPGPVASRIVGMGVPYAATMAAATTLPGPSIQLRRRSNGLFLSICKEG